TCPFVRYTGSFQAADHVADHALKGYSYKNVTVTNTYQCFSVCVLDCMCLSYQLSGTRCEVMDENRQTAPSDRFTPTRGYKYFQLKQTFKTQSIAAGCGGQCRNGCCRLISCLNGGKCVEKCDNVKRKFVCNCAPGYSGRLCENPIKSCAEHARNLNKQSGIRSIILPSGGELQVYCDFHSEPGFVWTLIESFTFDRNAQFQDKPFLRDFPVNHANPGWYDYRLSRSLMLHIKSHATLWRATCRYDIDGFQKRDYMRGLLSKMDILTFKDEGTCAHVQYINIRGQFCTECTTHFYQDTSTRHPYVDSHYGSIMGCSWSASSGSIKQNIGHGYSWDDNFGYFLVRNSAHRCSSSSSSTTQWWLGTAV
ncbi:hypothetical protein QZH41_008327, partial [Actinostola sp. cb2023]